MTWVDGCTRHDLTEGMIARWWKIAELRDWPVDACICCGGPCPMADTVAAEVQYVCKRCLPAGVTDAG